MSEVFRFVAQRPVQRAAPKEIGDKTIKAYEPLPGSSLHQQLRAEHREGDREGMVSVAQGFIASSPDFVGGLSALTSPLATLDAWLFDQGDRPNPAHVGEEVKRLTGKKPDQLVVTEAYKKDRQRVSDSLLALTVVPAGTGSLGAELLRAMHLFGLLERLARPAPASRDHDDDNNGGSGFDADDVYRLLARAVVLLPSDIFPLPEKSSDTPPPDVGLQTDGSAGLARVSGDGVEEHRVRLRDVLGAMEELKTAFDSRTSTAQHVEGNETGKSSARPWALPEGFRLSRATRDVVEEVAGRTALGNLPETINRLESEASTLGGVLAANGSPPVMVPMGSRLVDMRPFADGRAAADVLAQRAPAEALARTPGVADLLVVRQKVKRYEMGEVAHIENALKGETRERVHRRKTSTETTTTVETERTEETEQDLQSTERFELQREATKTVHNDAHLEGGVTVTASYGPTVEVTANAGFALNHSQDQSTRESSTYARDVTQRSVTRIQERVREERTVRTITEVEETNKHGIDNADGSGHMVGIYRWVDKIYEAQVFNYGKRLLLEFNVPEPAAFYRYAFAKRAPEGITLSPPEPPINSQTGKPLSPADIEPHNYMEWVEKYHVANASPPPKLYDTASLAVEEPVTEGEDGKLKRKTVFKAYKELKVPEGYKAIAYHINYLTDNYEREKMLLSWAVGDHSYHMTGPPGWWGFAGSFNLPTHLQGLLPVALYFHQVWGFVVTLEVICQRTDEKKAEWQLDTYEAIMRAYFELKAQYDEQVAAAMARQGVEITGRNPLRNRDIERNELKKTTISMLTGEHFDEFGAIVKDPEDPGKDYPEVDISEAQEEGGIVQFFEQAFEWPQMTYTFYPYFWGSKKDWLEVLQLDDADPIFASFLTAGSARVVVPVRPAFNDAVTHYLGTGQIWSGGPVPQVGDPLYVSIAQEIQEQLDAGSGGAAQGEPWEVRLPTTLAILQQNATLPVYQ